jgi:hypothetical protein
VGEEEMTTDRILEVLKEHGPITSVLDLGSEPLELPGYEVTRELVPGATADAVVMLDTLARLESDEATAAGLDTVRRRLRPGGLFLFDLLDGSVVLRDRPGNDFSRAPDGDTELVTAVLGSIDEDESLLCQQVRRWRLAGGQVVETTEETRRLRYFLPRELELVLWRGGFHLLDTAPLTGLRRLAWARPHRGGPGS